MSAFSENRMPIRVAENRVEFLHIGVREFSSQALIAEYRQLYERAGRPRD